LRAIRGALIDTNYRGAQLWASGLHEKLNALFDTVDSGDRAPSRQAREVLAVLSDQLEALLRRWRAAGGVRRSSAAARTPGTPAPATSRTPGTSGRRTAARRSARPPASRRA